MTTFLLNSAISCVCVCVPFEFIAYIISENFILGYYNEYLQVMFIYKKHKCGDSNRNRHQQDGHTCSRKFRKVLKLKIVCTTLLQEIVSYLLFIFMF